MDSWSISRRSSLQLNQRGDFCGRLLRLDLTPDPDCLPRATQSSMGAVFSISGQGDKGSLVQSLDHRVQHEPEPKIGARTENLELRKSCPVGCRRDRIGRWSFGDGSQEDEPRCPSFCILGQRTLVSGVRLERNLGRIISTTT